MCAFQKLSSPRLIALSSFLLLIPFLAPICFGQESKESSLIDQAEYNEIMANRVSNAHGIEDLLTEQQATFLPITPPAPELILAQPWIPDVVPFSTKEFPADFLKSLPGYYEYSVPVYPLTVIEDPKTRETVFFNSDGKEFYSLTPPYGYDPFDVLRQKWPWLFDGKHSADEVELYKALYDPARIQLTAKLISEDDVEHYLYAKARVAAAAAALAPLGPSGGGMMLMMVGGDATNDFFICSLVQTNGLEVGVHIPETTNFTVDVFTFDADIYRTFDGLTYAWDIAATNLIVATNSIVLWTDAVYQVSANRFYGAGNADRDADGDGVPDDREIFVYKSSTNSVDSDGDGMSDGAEVAQSLPPAYSNGAAQVSIRSPLNGAVLP